MADRIFLLPDATTLAAARLIDIIGAAAVARQFPHDVVLIRAPARADDILALNLKLGQAAFGDFDLLQEFFALRA